MEVSKNGTTWYRSIVAIAPWLAGIVAFVGGCLAHLEGTAEIEGKQEFIYGIVAFALVPEGMATLSLPILAATFCGGGLVFCILDAAISRTGGSKAQFMAMLLDFVPEAIALGALFGHSHKTGLLLALFIGAQNLPEGFNAYRESTKGKAGTKGSLLVLLAASLLGPVSASCGYLFLRDQQFLTGCIMSFAGGGILYLVFQDIAPQSKMQQHWSPPLGAVLGFVVGMIGKQVVG